MTRYVFSLFAIMGIAFFAITSIYYGEQSRQWILDNPSSLYWAAAVMLLIGVYRVVTKIRAFRAATDEKAKSYQSAMAISAFGLCLLALVVAATPSLLPQ